MDDLLDPTPALVQGVAGQAHHMERIHHGNRGGQLLGRGGLEPGEPVHRDDLDDIAPRLRALRQPGLERLFGAALDNVQQPRWPRAGADRGQVDDHGDVLVPASGVAPHVLIHADRGDAVQTLIVFDQGPLALGEDGVVGGVPRDPEAFGDPGDREVLNHDPLQRPPQPAPRQLRPGDSRSGGVLSPHVPALTTAVSTDQHHQRRGSPPERLVCEATNHGVADLAPAAAATTPSIGFEDPARQQRTVGLESLASDLEAEFV